MDMSLGWSMVNTPMSGRPGTHRESRQPVTAPGSLWSCFVTLVQVASLTAGEFVA